MITLITGTPGAGKTLWTVSELINEIYGQTTLITRIKQFITKEKPVLNDRPLYIHGIPNLEIGVSYHQIYCKSPLCDVCQSQKILVIPEPLYRINEFGEAIQVNQDDILLSEKQRDFIKYVENWSEWADEGGLIILDEVQRIWRPRSSGAAVPPEISALETHRHKGLDFWLISQNGKLLDQNIRRLVNRHIHLSATWKGRFQFEWSEYKENVTSTSDSVSRPYILNKDVFGKYKSATLHTTLKKRYPIAVYVVGVCAVLLSYLVYDLVQKFTKVDTLQQTVKVETIQDPLKINSNDVQTLSQSKTTSKTTSKKHDAVTPDFKPRQAGRAETAPAYDNLLKIQSVPFPNQCLAWTSEKGKFCKCLTDQGTPYQMAYDTCIAYAKGEVYNPYIPPKNSIEQPVLPTKSAQKMDFQVAKN